MGEVKVHPGQVASIPRIMRENFPRQMGATQERAGFGAQNTRRTLTFRPRSFIGARYAFMPLTGSGKAAAKLKPWRPL